jgi:hypothetical protein
MSDNSDLEARLLGTLSSSNYEQEIQDNIEKEIIQARLDREKELNKEAHQTVLTDINDIHPGKKFDKASIYKVFNRKLKTETFVNGEQAENIIKYINDYIVRFDHRVEIN